MARLCWLALLATHTTVAVAAPNAWTRTGPEGGPAWSIEYATATPGVALATAGHAIYRTTDSGVTWTEAHPLSVVNNFHFTRDPSNSSHLFAVGPNGNPPQRTADGGQTFTQDVRFVTPNGSAIESAIAMASNGVWYGGTTLGTMFLSSNQGATWEPRSNGLPPVGSLSSREVQRILIDPRDPNRVYVLLASPFPNLYSTLDGGMTWALHSGVCATACSDIALNPRAPDELLASGGGGLYASSDAGQTWTQRDPRIVSTVRFDPLVPNRVLALTLDPSLMRSDDGGQTWATTSLPITAFNNLAAAIAFDPLQAGRILLGTGQGILFSEDAGTTWVARNAGIDGATVGRVISTSPGITGARTFAVGTTMRPGLLAYDTVSQRWNPVGNGSFEAAFSAAHILSFDYVDSAPDTLYAGGFIGGLFRSDDGGQTWSKPTTSLDNSVIYAVAASASNAQSLYVSTDAGAVLYSVNGGSTFVSHSGGLPPGAITELVVDPDDDNRLYAVQRSSTPGLYRTANGGVTWDAVDGGIGSVEILEIAVDPEDFAVVYAATSTGLAKSTDSGVTWAFLPGNHFVGHVAVDRYDGAHLLRASYQVPQHGLQRSLDGGQTWELIGRPGLGQSRGVAFDYTKPSSLMTIVDTGGVQTIQIAPDLEITSSATAVAQNSPRTVRVDLRNRGPYAASRVVLTASVARTGAAAQTPRGQCAAIGNTGSLRCDVGIVRADETVPITFTLPELLAGDAAVRFEASGREPDVDLVNNTVTLNVERQSDVAVTLSSSAATVTREQSVTLVLTVSNGDFSPAEDVRFTLQMPASLEIGAISTSLPACIGAGGSLSCAIGALARHSSTELRFTATARQAGPAVVSVSVTSLGPDPLPANNSASTTINVTAPAAASGGGGGGGAFSWPFVLLLACLAAWRRGRRGLVRAS